MSNLSINIRKFNRVDMVTVSGRIDSSSTEEFDMALKGLYTNGRKKLILQLADVSFMSSSGLRAMVAAQRECDGGVVIATPSERVAEVLDLSGLKTVFQIYDAELDAVGSF